VLADALRDSVRFPVLWAAGGLYGAVEAGLLALTLGGETFFSTRLTVLTYLLLPFLLAGAYGVLREQDGSPRRFAAEGIGAYFRVILPALVAAFVLGVVLLAVLAVLELGAALPAEFAAGVALVLLVPAAVVLSLYDAAACLEGLGVFASLRRSISLALAHPGRVVGFLLTVVAVLAVLGFALLVAWTTVLFARLEPLASMPPAELAGFGAEEFAGIVGTGGIVLGGVCYALFAAVAFVLVTTYKARLFPVLAEASPVVQHGEYDEKGRWYKY
jgi:hypothetical protein